MRPHTTRAETPGTAHSTDDVLLAAGGLSVAVVVATLALTNPLLAAASVGFAVLATVLNRPAGPRRSPTVRHDGDPTRTTG